MYFAHHLKIFALVKARDEDMHSPQQAGNLLHSKSLSRISIVQMHSQQQWMISVHRVEAGFSNWQGISHPASSIFFFCNWSMPACKLPHFSGVSPPTIQIFPLKKSRSPNFGHFEEQLLLITNSGGGTMQVHTAIAPAAILRYSQY